MSIIFSLMFTDTIIAILSSQVVSLLRLKHNMKAEVCQLSGCDYIVSNRMAVKRKTASGNLVVVFCENHLRRVTAQRLCETLRKKICAKKNFVKPKRGARLIFSRGNQMLYQRVYLRTLALYFLLFHHLFFVWVAWSASYSKTLLFYSEVSLIWPPET